jgi:hypothetical protein
MPLCCHETKPPKHGGEGPFGQALKETVEYTFLLISLLLLTWFTATAGKKEDGKEEDKADGTNKVN